jgi:hypothetical protein
MEDSTEGVQEKERWGTSGMGVKKLSVTHHAIMDWLLLNPAQSMRDCADHFRISQSWLSCIVNSGCFKDELAKRRIEISSVVAQDLPMRLQTVSHLALDNIARHLEKSSDPEYALKALDSAMKGVASLRPAAGAVSLNVNTQNNVQQLFASPEDLAKARLALRSQQGALLTVVQDSERSIVDAVQADGEQPSS